jgi:hypothetical protein
MRSRTEQKKKCDNVSDSTRFIVRRKKQEECTSSTLFKETSANNVLGKTEGKIMKYFY